MALEYFTDEELSCPLTGEIRLADGFGAWLDALRDDCGFAMPLTSCCRSMAHNRAINGHVRSLHMFDNSYHETDTCAVDVGMSNGIRRAALISKALARGASVGVASSFIHIDRRTEYTGLPQVVFHYQR